MRSHSPASAAWSEWRSADPDRTSRGLFLIAFILAPFAFGAALTPPTEPPCLENFSELFTKAEQTKNGGLRTEEGHVYPIGTYYSTDSGMRGCACQVATCFFKCCPWGSEIHVKGCVATRNSSMRFVLDVYSADNLTGPQSRGVSPPPEWIVLTGRPDHRHMFRLQPKVVPGDEYFLLENATLLAPSMSSVPYRADQFCMDVFSDTGEVSPLVVFNRPEDKETFVGDVTENSYMFLYPVGLLLSLPFLLATFLVYCTFSELRNLHGKSLMCHVGAMIAAYVDLCLVQLRVGILNPPVCKVLGFLLQFSFLACFFWLNVMCFDLWWTFSGFRAMRPSRERHKFWLYSLYAWGGPLVILLVTVFLHEFPNLPAGFVRPVLGFQSCYFDTREARLVYFVIPVSVLLLCNLLLFVHTTWRIVALRRETRALQNGESQRHTQRQYDDRQRYNVYLKLFLIMGVNWIAEVVSDLFPNLRVVWMFPDIGNSLQGILIFIMFVWTGRVKRLVRERILDPQSASATALSSASTKRTNTNLSTKSGGG